MWKKTQKKYFCVIERVQVCVAKTRLQKDLPGIEGISIYKASESKENTLYWRNICIRLGSTMISVFFFINDE